MPIGKSKAIWQRKLRNLVANFANNENNDDQILNQSKLCHLLTKFASGAISWPNLQLMQVVPSGGKICNFCKWRHLVAKFATNARGATLWTSLLMINVCYTYLHCALCKGSIVTSYVTRLWHLNCGKCNIKLTFNVLHSAVQWKV